VKNIKTGKIWDVVSVNGTTIIVRSILCNGRKQTMWVDEKMFKHNWCRNI